MESLSEPSLNLLSANDFSSQTYVKELSQNCVGGPELRRLRKKIQTLSEDTSSTLKKNVYQNYMQFIDTAKEISHLESEMYQLSHYLSEQKTLLNLLASTSILGDDNLQLSKLDNKDSTKSIEQGSKEKIASILEKVDGCREFLETPGKVFIHEGPLVELDPVENTSIKSVQAYLFSDGFITTVEHPTNHGMFKYQYESIYELGSLAIVNAKDLGNIKHAFKVLNFPETRVFKCPNSIAKAEWLDKFDHAKKTRLVQDQQKRESIAEKSTSRATSIDSPSIHPLDESEESLFKLHPPWFVEIPEELDVCVAQRHFEDALELFQKAKDYIAQVSTNHGQLDHVVSDIQRKVEQRHNHLTEVLMKELEVNQDKSLQGGLRASRRAVQMLNKLGRSNQACDLFLKLCSNMLKAQCKRVKREGSTSMYVQHLSSVVFTNMCHMTEEFLRAFPTTSSCFSAYVVWASGELSLFSTHFIKQVFVPQTSLATLAECIVLVRLQCDRLGTYGVDLGYQLDGAIRNYVAKWLKEGKEKLRDTIKLRATEDKWRPLNLKSKAALGRYLQEHSAMGINLEPYVADDVWLQLTTNTLSFTKLYLNLLDNCLKLKTTDLLYTIDESLYDIFDAQIRHIELSLRAETQFEQRQFIIKNAEFLLVTLLNLVQTNYSESVGFKCEVLLKLHKEYSAVLSGISPTSRNVKSKYSSEYL